MATEAGWLSYEDIISDAARRVRDIDHSEINRMTMVRWASEGNREFARRSQVVRGVNYQPLIAEQAIYRLPANCFRVKMLSIHYPGYTDHMELPYISEPKTFDGFAATSGIPECWFLRPDRQSIGLYPTPALGGADEVTTSAGNAGGTTLVCTALSSTDDFYNGLECKIIDGDLEGQEETIDDYDGTTTTVTIDTALTAQIGSGVRFQIAPESLRIDCIEVGNSYAIFPTTATVSADVTATYARFSADLPERPPNHWKGAEVEFTSGNLDGYKTRIVTSKGLSTYADLTVSPELPLKPAENDTIKVTDVPNIPPAYHHAIVEWVVYQALRTRESREAGFAWRNFMSLAEEAEARDHPAQYQEFQVVREFGRGREVEM